MLTEFFHNEDQEKQLKVKRPVLLPQQAQAAATTAQEFDSNLSLNRTNGFNRTPHRLEPIKQWTAINGMNATM